MRCWPEGTGRGPLPSRAVPAGSEGKSIIRQHLANGRADAGGAGTGDERHHEDERGDEPREGGLASSPPGHSGQGPVGKRWTRVVREAGGLAVSFVLVMIGLFVVFDMDQVELGIPVSYAGDAVLTMNAIQNIDTQGWYLETPNLGAPYGQDLHDFPAAGDFTHLLAMRGLLLFTDNPAAALNVYFFFSFFLITASAYSALRLLGASVPIAAAIGTVYAFLPGHLLRGADHLFISAYFVVPLVVLLVVRQLGDRPLLSVGRGAPWRSWGGLGGLGIAALAGTTGLYYAAFSVLLLVLAAVLGAASRDRRPAALGSALLGTVVAGLLALQLLPTLLYQRRNGDNLAVVTRTFGEVETYALKIVTMLLPTPGHRIDALASVRSTAAASPVPNSGLDALGLIAAMGFILCLWRMVRMLTGGASHPTRDALAMVAVVMSLIATVGGFSALLAALGFAQIRVWERASVVIGFAALAIVAVMASSIRLTFRGHSAVIWSVAVITALAGVLDQSTPSMRPGYQVIRANWLADEAFAEEVGKTLGAGAMVFQLPVTRFPEEPPVERMLPYDQLKPYLHEPSIRWSHGGVKGRQADWQLNTLSRPPRRLVEDLIGAGFQGITVDRLGYPDDGEGIIEDLTTVTGVPPVSSPNDRLVLFDLRPLAAELRAEGELRGLQRQGTALVGLVPRFGSGFSPTTIGATGITAVMSGTADLVITSYLDGPTPAELRFRAMPTDETRPVVEIGDGETSALFEGAGREVLVRFRTNLAPGENTISITDLTAPTGTLSIDRVAVDVTTCDDPSCEPSLALVGDG